ncbi:transmembrane protein 184C-like isoform X2 [Hetaerina americana]|uniref:transmembrane protein 184C-like isoform X2 n=1 Tax=Hetaerina americana TaxID=62018 RepID=UPI003A7F153D
MSCQSLGALLSKWRLWIRPVVMSVYALVIVVILPMIIANAVKRGFRKEDQGAIIGGVFVMMSLPISFWGIIQHLVHYTKPHLQKHIIRILWMVPIYALNAWLGLAFPAVSIYLDSLRECYEAYVIYNFMAYLLNYLNSRMNLEASLAMKPQVNHIFPLCCLQPWEMGSEFVHMCKHGILQYTVVRPFTTIVSFICEMNHVYGEGEFRGDYAFPYMIAVNNFSQFVAMYCLVLFYKANREELAPMKPIGKFLCIKAVVFFSFFQGVIIAILVYTGVISSVFGTNDSSSIKDISSKLQGVRSAAGLEVELLATSQLGRRLDCWCQYQMTNQHPLVPSCNSTVVLRLPKWMSLRRGRMRMAFPLGMTLLPLHPCCDRSEGGLRCSHPCIRMSGRGRIAITLL